MSDIYVVDVVRTPVGKAPRGVFKTMPPDDLLVQVLQALQQRQAELDWRAMGDVVIGCATPEGAQGMNVARIATLLSGLPESVPAMTLNRFCASGIQSVATAAAGLSLGGYDLAIAGGLESMSSIPLGGHNYRVNPRVFSDDHVAIAYGMGITAEKVAQKWQVSREQQDEFALESHTRALAAIARGDFKTEIHPVTLTQRAVNLASGELTTTLHEVSEDEGPRIDTSLAALARLKPVFALHGSVTAGNSSQTSDGAAAALLATEAGLVAHGLKPIGRLLSYAVAGVPPEVMGIGPVHAIPKALMQAGLTLDQIDWIELNEAFAAQALAVINTLGLDKAKVNPLGGAIALGHPLGATGTIRLATLLHGLRRTGGRYGMVTMCIGTGMGAAAIFEAL